MTGIAPADEVGLLRDEVNALRQELHQTTRVVSELRYEIYVTLDRRLHARALRYIAAVVVIGIALACVTWRISDWGVRRALQEVAAREAGDCRTREESREGARIIASGVNDLAQIAKLIQPGEVRDRITRVGANMDAALADQLAPAHCIDSGELVVDKGAPAPPHNIRVPIITTRSIP